MTSPKTQVLATLEELEASQINCGCYTTQISLEDLCKHFWHSNSSNKLSESDIQEALQQLIDEQEVIEWKSERYRSRIAETVRILRLLRQRFWWQKSLVNSPLLIEDVRVEFRQRRRPKRNAVSAAQAIPTGVPTAEAEKFLQAIQIPNFSNFQERAIQQIFACSQQQNVNDTSFIIAGDTGAGKTEAFLFPILLDILSEPPEERKCSGVRAVLVYPRIRLARNQLGRLLRYIGRLKAAGASSITVGIQNGDTPRNNEAIAERWSVKEYSNRYLVRLLESCIECEQGRYWVEQDELHKDCPNLICDHCGHTIDSLYLTQETLSNQAPDLLIITDVSLSQWMVRERYTHLWGLWSGEKQTIPPRYLVLDEVHLYEQIKGSHIARLIKRFQSRVRLVYKNIEQARRNPIVIGVSATLNDEHAFLAKLLSVNKNDVNSSSKLQVIKPQDDELEDTEGRERYIFICPRRLSPTPKNREYRVNDQTAAIQIVMATMHNLKRDVEWRGLAFFDSINDLRQFAENYKSDKDGANTQELWKIRTDSRKGQRNLHSDCGGTICLNRLNNHSLDSCSYFQAGDCWIFAKLGGCNRQLQVANSIYAGSASELDGTDLIPSSPSLEVGYDDDAIQLVYQHKAPPNAASFIQRRGRAGRNPNDSPIIVTMLWPHRSGDMFYYYHPDALYDPSFDDAPLNANNFNVQRTHALLAFFDLLACLRAQNLDDLGNDPAIIDFTQAGNALFSISDRVLQSWTPLPDPYRPGQERLLIKHRITKKNIWLSGGQLNHIQQDDNILKVKGWLALDKELTFQVLRKSWERLSEKGLFEEYINLSEIASLTFKQHSTYPYQTRQGNPLPINFLDQFGHKDWHSNHDCIEKGNWIKTFRYIDWMLQGKEDATTLIVHYPNHQQSNNDELEFDEATLDLTFALTELLPGNVSYRLRDEGWIHWTPIPQEGESTFLYPEEDELDESGEKIGRRIVTEYKPGEDDLANKPDSIFGVPRYINHHFPDLKFISLKRLRVEKFSKPSEQASDIWYFNIDSDRSIEVKPEQDPPPNSVPIARRTASRANSIVIPYIASARGVERRNLDAPLNTLFSTIEGYVTDGTAMLGYTRVFYEMQIDLKTSGKKKYKKLLKDNKKETLLRHFYPPNPKKNTEDKAEPVLVGYSLETHGIAFNINSDLLDRLVKNVLEDESLRLSIRRKMALYQFSSYASDNSLFMAEVLRLAEVVIDYWIHQVVPASTIYPRLLNYDNDLQNSKDYYKAHRNIQSPEIEIFSQVVNQNFIEKINEVLDQSFKNTQEFNDFVKSTILYSLSALLKNLVARLGGVSSEDLITYADLPVLDKVDCSNDPRIFILDKVEGGSGAMAQAFERLELSTQEEVSEASLWWTLIRYLGQCPIAHGEEAVKTVLTQANENQIKLAQENPTPNTLDNLLNQLQFKPTSEARQKVGNTLFGNLEIGNYQINPALIIKELLTLHNQFNSSVPGVYPKEAAVCKTVQMLDQNLLPHTHISQLRDALRDNGVAQDDLNRELAIQLMALYNNSCEDGCPVCMSEGADIEHYHLAPLLRSRKVLNKLREQLLDGLTKSDCLANLAERLQEGESVEVQNNTELLDNQVEPQLGLAVIQKVNDSGQLDGSIAIPLKGGQTISEVLTTQSGWEERWEHQKYKPYKLPDNRRVRSRGELTIATWLIEQDISFDLEVPISYRNENGETCRIHPNFHIYDHDLYIEYWGEDSCEYMESRQVKEEAYSKRNKKFIAIDENDLVDNLFAQKIQAIIDMQCSS